MSSWARDAMITNPLRRSPHPLLLEVPVRPWLRDLAARAGRELTLATVPDATLDAIAERGFHGVWLMGVWRTSPAARRLALSHPSLLATYETMFPDWTPAEVPGSPYAVGAYEVAPSLGGDAALAELRARLAARGVGLMLDFIANHFACDHAWIDDHPDFFVRGTPRDLAREPGNWFCHVGRNGADRVIAHGRDPHFDGWSDTAQLDVRRPETRRALTELLASLASRCDGLRCDVAMLLLADVFHRTWGSRDGEIAGEFWREAILALRAQHPQTLLLAEVYWGLESRLVDLGFDFAYDKGVLDALASGDLRALRNGSALPFDERARRAHFLENHDEPRATAVFGQARLPAAALFAYTLPGMRFLQEGQIEGRRLRAPVQIARLPEEEEPGWCRALHERILGALRDPAFHVGRWEALHALPAASGDSAHESVFGNGWSSNEGTWLAIVNLSGATARARLGPLSPELDGVRELRDHLSDRTFERSMHEMQERMITVDLAPHEARLLHAPLQRSRPLEVSSRGS
jgi:hypothetical protein